MSNNNKIVIPDIGELTPEAAAAQEITLLTANSIEWLDYGQSALEAGNTEEAGVALKTLRSNLLELLKSNALTPAIFQMQAQALQEATAQYTKLAQSYEVVQATFNKQLGEGLDETLEHMLGCEDCRDEVEIELLANRMMDEGMDEIEAEARETLERRLTEARELAHSWKHDDGLEKGPGISSNFTFRANPAYPDPNGILEDLDDDDPDEGDPDLLTDGDDDAEFEDEEN